MKCETELESIYSTVILEGHKAGQRQFQSDFLKHIKIARTLLFSVYIYIKITV
jgi:hypothetical protein